MPPCEGLAVADLPLKGLAVAILPLIGLAVAVAVCLCEKGLGFKCGVSGGTRKFGGIKVVKKVIL